MCEEIRPLEPKKLYPEPFANGGGEPPTLTPYLPGGEQPTAAMVICPGGGYEGLADHEGEPVARWLGGLGIAGLVLRYRVAPSRHPEPLHDARRAIRLARASAEAWRIDPKRVGILGFSAGGHLAASAATMARSGNPQAEDPVERLDSRPDLAVLGYPVITFGPAGHEGSMRNLLGPDPLPAMQQALSIENRVTHETSPTFLWHTADDATVPVDNALLMAAALTASAVPYELHVFPSGPHGLGLGCGCPRVGEWTCLCADWLMMRGFCRE